MPMMHDFPSFYPNSTQLYIHKLYDLNVLTCIRYKYEVPCDLSSTDQSEPANFHHHS